MTRQVGNEIDEFVTEALRNNLLGLPLDLATINLARGRDTGVPSLNAARREFYDGTGDSQLKPYRAGSTSRRTSSTRSRWSTSSPPTARMPSSPPPTSIRWPRSAPWRRRWCSAAAPSSTQATADERTFTADEPTGSRSSTAPAPTPTADGVTTTGVDDIDLWIGGLAEKQMPFGGLLGSTFNFVFETQLEALQNGDRLLLPDAHCRPQLPHRAGEQLVRRADHGEHGRDAPAGRRVLDADLHPRGRSDQAVHRPGTGKRRPAGRQSLRSIRWSFATIRGHRELSKPTTCTTPATTTSCSAAPRATTP